MNTGEIIGPIRVTRVAHGGHCVAHHDGRVIFVRHGLPDELVRVRVTDNAKAAFWRGDVVEVLEPSPDRVSPPCPMAGVCGGCDFQHVLLDSQRRLKAFVVEEQLQRLSGIFREVIVSAAPGDEMGLGWRTRMRYQVVDGAVGLHAHRSDRVIKLPETGCLIAHPAGRDPHMLSATAIGCSEILVAVADSGVTTTCAGTGGIEIAEQVNGRRYLVKHDGFWQSHVNAPKLLVDTVIEILNPRPGEQILDLYCGVGLFAGALVDVGAGVIGVEANRAAAMLARGNVSQARFEVGKVEHILPKLQGRVDGIVLDPPRSGAGKTVVRQIAAHHPKKIVYIACDPSSLARDLGFFREYNYELVQIRAFDLFPMTHHVECLAELRPHA